jgi:phytoene/squalene synthetase
MDAIDYCVDKVATQGTPGYYAVLFQPPYVRAALIALRALERELSDVAELCTDRSVAQRKLDYWRQELLGNSASASHPVTRAMQKFTGDVLDDDARSQLLTGTAQRITREQYRDDAQLDGLSSATAGIIALACARVAGEDHSGAVETALAAERLRLLSFPQRAGLPAHSGVALSTLTACAVTPQQLDRGGIEPGLIALRTSLLNQALVATRRADQLTEQRRGYVATCARMTACQLSASRRNDYARNGKLAHATPLRLLWHAWRARP